MKKTRKFLTLILSVFVAFLLFAACGDTSPLSSSEGASTSGSQSSENSSDNGSSVSELKEFSGLTLEDRTVVYNGTEHSLALSGNFPKGLRRNLSAILRLMRASMK